MLASVSGILVSLFPDIVLQKWSVWLSIAKKKYEEEGRERAWDVTKVRSEEERRTREIEKEETYRVVSHMLPVSLGRLSNLLLSRRKMATCNNCPI